MTTVREDARALLPENYQGWDCDGSASICDERVAALRALLERVEFLEDNRLPGLEADAMRLDVIESGPADEREALAQTLHNMQEEIYPVALSVRADRYYAQAGAVLAAGFRRQPPITDAQVEAVAKALYEIDGGYNWDADAPDWPGADKWRANARSILEAARDAS